MAMTYMHPDFLTLDFDAVDEGTGVKERLGPIWMVCLWWTDR